MRRTVTAVLALVALVGTAAPSYAEVTVVKDPSRDTPRHSRYGDLHKVRVNHGIGNLKVVIRATQNDYALLWIDTDATDPGPEFVVDISAEYPRASVYRVDDFGPAGAVIGPGDGTLVQGCDALPGGIVKKAGAYAGFRYAVPRRCLGSPPRVRVAAQTAQDYPGTTVDWAPGVRRFGPWTRSGPV